jgi:hypothetical protein
LKQQLKISGILGQLLCMHVPAFAGKMWALQHLHNRKQKIFF